MKINKPQSKLKHLAIAFSVVFGLTACFDSDDNDQIVVEPPPTPPVNVAPVVSSSAVTSAEEGVLYTYTFTATDADVGDTLVLASVTLPGSGWLTFDIATGVLSGTPAAGDAGDNAVSLTVSDGTDTVTQDFTIVVAAAPVVNTAPVFTSTGPTMGTVGTAITYTATATDADAGDTLTYALVTQLGDLATDAAFDTDTGVLTFTPEAAGDYLVEITVTDGTDTVTQDFTIVVAAAPVVNTAPVFTSTGPTMGTVGTAITYTATATDADAGDTLTYALVNQLGDLATDAAFDTDTGVLTFTPEAAGDYLVEITVTDGVIADPVSQTFTIVVTEASNVVLTVFEDAEVPEWAFFTDASAGAEVISDVAPYNEVVQFSISSTNANTVAGFTARTAGTPFDASAYASTGALSFDMKVVTNTPGADTPWYLKLEAGVGGPNTGDYALSSSNEGLAPVTGDWQTYTFDLADLAAAGVDLSAIDIMLIFPAYGQGAGAVYLVDNFKLENFGNPGPTPERTFAGTWQVEPVAGSLGVGPARGDISWFAIDDAGVTQRSCFYDDGYVFGRDGTFNNDLGDDTWVEEWQSGSPDACGAAVAPYDGAVSQTWTYTEGENEDVGTLLIDGLGGYTGIPKANNDGELPAVSAPLGITYEVTWEDDNTVVIDIESGANVWWRYRMIKTVQTDPVAVAGVADTADFGDLLNGGFENGLDDWLATGSVSVVTPDTGSNFVKIATTGEASIYQDGIGAGTYTAGQAITVSFEMKGTAGPSAEVVGILYTDNLGGEPAVTKTDFLRPSLNADWTPYTFDFIVGEPVGATGVSLRLSGVCGAVAGCFIEANIDNIKIALTN
jgi:hypothetical protein